MLPEPRRQIKLKHASFSKIRSPVFFSTSKFQGRILAFRNLPVLKGDDYLGEAGKTEDFGRKNSQNVGTMTAHRSFQNRKQNNYDKIYLWTKEKLAKLNIEEPNKGN
ncbi:hypothetical protein LEP1GSC047_0488 [Leptospira inadai serovar Lyme str. 10]|uniref:Uncharacterized protein n=2 Tax=Leptospira inadai serovar Lyme TaxID=293084 RepID=V6HB79_9LEPT|nr:hypothetical protein LEP1GSC047_0488 [Leptospira inadai serovar Lyme str. 10]PNV76959.1 hypothetical protein BES34_001415 [Leptospira inadai serovar Lyme]